MIKKVLVGYSTNTAFNKQTRKRAQKNKNRVCVYEVSKKNGYSDFTCAVFRLHFYIHRHLVPFCV